MDLSTIAQTVSAIGTVLLAALFGYQVTVFKKQVAVNRGTLDEMREGRAAHERPQVVVTAEYRHGALVKVVIANIGRGDAKNVAFGFSAPMESSVSYRRDSEVVPLSELPHFRDGLSYLAPGAEIATVWDHHANLVPLLREMGLQEGITVTSRYESLTGEPYETPWTINPLLLSGGLYAPRMNAPDTDGRRARRTERAPALAKRFWSKTPLLVARRPWSRHASRSSRRGFRVPGVVLEEHLEGCQKPGVPGAHRKPLTHAPPGGGFRGGGNRRFSWHALIHVVPCARLDHRRG